VGYDSFSCKVQALFERLFMLRITGIISHFFAWASLGYGLFSVLAKTKHESRASNFVAFANHSPIHSPVLYALSLGPLVSFRFDQGMF
jgi:hypothetical protein